MGFRIYTKAVSLEVQIFGICKGRTPARVHGMSVLVRVLEVWSSRIRGYEADPERLNGPQARA